MNDTTTNNDDPVYIKIMCGIQADAIAKICIDTLEYRTPQNPIYSLADVITQEEIRSMRFFFRHQSDIWANQNIFPHNTEMFKKIWPKFQTIIKINKEEANQICRYWWREKISRNTVDA